MILNGELDRCLREQRECLDYIAANGHDHGAWLGFNDWLAEEILIRLECAEDRQRQTEG